MPEARGSAPAAPERVEPDGSPRDRRASRASARPSPVLATDASARASPRVPGPGRTLVAPEHRLTSIPRTSAEQVDPPRRGLLTGAGGEGVDVVLPPARGMSSVDLDGGEAVDRPERARSGSGRAPGRRGRRTRLGALAAERRGGHVVGWARAASALGSQSWPSTRPRRPMTAATRPTAYAVRRRRASESARARSRSSSASTSGSRSGSRAGQRLAQLVVSQHRRPPLPPGPRSGACAPGRGAA